MDASQAVDLALRSVREAAELSLRYFRPDIKTETKADRSIVTEADVACEKVILQRLRTEDPEAAILAEESGLHGPPSSKRWIVDPIDGTRGFARGGEFWGPMVALEIDGIVVAGALALPARNQFFWASSGGGAFKDGQKLAVSAVADPSEATLSLGETTRLLRAPYRAAVSELIDRVASTRGLGDLAAATLVAEGKAEIWLECGVKPWDIAVARVLIEEAGGRFTNFEGTTRLEAGTALGSNGLLHDLPLERLRADLDQAEPVKQ